ncbi:Nitronate monooxygenase [Phaeobacter sp. CECT 5382]|uniref:nitronate monooxygenase n=1 Tax=Phaeobacter sp. CECT 5382 TaxID=1712645 RepID=UPI0006DA261D|nr:nitronate monooxygenase [Phaeobacter sp. CECT 5382]CUH87851.1 Nitronate monooxygenase [Phaeobacter sp. CECT 5382]
MNSDLCKRLGIEFPLFAFSHCRDVVAAVTNAGGMGIFGAAMMSPEELEEELAWIDAHVDGRPYGVDLIVPNKFEAKGEDIPDAAILAMVPEGHKEFADGVMQAHGMGPGELEAKRAEQLVFRENISAEGAARSLDVAFAHPIALIANALGLPPQDMLDRGKAQGVAVGALVGTAEHARAQVAAGVDVIIAAGGEAGGHTGEISTMVLVPEVVQAIAGSNVPVLAAGGIATGSQMAAAMAMGAAGAWCGSVWLTTAEAETNPVVKEKMLAASSRDTVRSRSRTGKPSRQLVSAWTEAWEGKGAPKPLPMPLQTLVSEPALHRIDQMSQKGHEGAQDLATYWVGQGVGLMNQAMSAGGVVQEFKEDFLTAYERLQKALEG